MESTHKLENLCRIYNTHNPPWRKWLYTITTSSRSKRNKAQAVQSALVRGILSAEYKRLFLFKVFSVINFCGILRFLVIYHTDSVTIPTIGILQINNYSY